MEGRTVDGFVVGAFVGRGSFGVVYKAEKDGLTYAIKFIDIKNIASAYDTPDRLDREIEALKRVSSPYTVQYVADGYYSDNHMDYKYIVMEFIEGDTLEAILAKNPAPWTVERSIGFVTELLHGLDIIHGNNIIHRDLKLDNIAICTDGQLKIIDYGLSKLIDFSTITQSGTRIGAPHFMSPEQMLDGKNITKISDYYAIGVVLYLLLTGQLLFESVTEQEIIYKTVNVKPPLPSTLNARIPTHIENVIMKLLSKQAYERYPNVEDILTALTTPVPVEVHTGSSAVKFYPRLMNGDTAIIETFLTATELDGADFPIHEHTRSKKLTAALHTHKDSLDLIADPGTNRMVYTGFRKTASLKDLPYAPQGYNPYEIEDFDDETKVRDFVKSVIDRQIATDCTIITAPYFYFDNASDDWFSINIKLLRESHSYIRTQYPGYSLSAAICTQAETISRKKDQKLIIEQYTNVDYEYLQIYVDSVKETMNDAQLYNYIKTALSIKEFTKAKLIAGRVPAVALGLLCIGFDAITSGLAVLDSFDKSIIEKDNDFSRMPIKHYFSDLLMAVPLDKTSGVMADIIAAETDLRQAHPEYTVNLGSQVPDNLKAGLSANNQIPKLEFLFSRSAEIGDINAADRDARKDHFLARIDKAIDLRKALVKRGIKLPSGDGLKTWAEVLKQF